jgi:hypothetical protein
MGLRAGHGPSFQANRMFLRTMGYLWCVGNPREPFEAPRAAPRRALNAREKGQMEPQAQHDLLPDLIANHEGWGEDSFPNRI